MKKLKLNFSAGQRFWAVAKPYWWDSQERCKAIRLLLFIMFLVMLQAKMNVLQNAQRGEFTSALAEKNAGRFWQAVLTYLGACMLFVTLQTFRHYFVEKLRWFWRGWLTHLYLQQYMKNRNFYWLGSWTAKIDNPDQRISQDIENFCYMSLLLFMDISSSVVNIVAFGVVLWSMSHNLVILLIVYAGVGMMITTVGFGRILIPLKTEQLKREANFRFGLVRIRENAESIAFYGGDHRELNNVGEIFKTVLSNYNQIIRWERNLEFFSSGYQVITWILPG